MSNDHMITIIAMVKAAGGRLEISDRDIFEAGTGKYILHRRNEAENNRIVLTIEEQK